MPSRPQAVLIEGPPEADALIALAADAAMRPPVALLAHVVRRPGAGRRSGPSPSSRRSGWRSGGPAKAGARSASSTCRPPTRWPCGPRGRPAVRTGRRRSSDPAVPATPGPGVPAEPPGRPQRRKCPTTPPTPRSRPPPSGSTRWRCSPRPPGTTTRSAGGRTSSSTGRSGRRRTRSAPFAALAEAMTVLRETYGDGGHPRDPSARPTCGSGSARPRQGVRADAPWSAGPGMCPRSPGRTTAAADRALLKGLPKVKVETDLGALDAPPARPAQRLRRGHRLAGLVRAPVHRARPARRRGG